MEQTEAKSGKLGAEMSDGGNQNVAAGANETRKSFHLQQANNPLQLDAILENVMSRLNVEQLKTCRLVNKQFNYHANRRLHEMNATTVSLRGNKSFVNFDKIFKKYKRELGAFPLTRFLIHNKVTKGMSRKLQEYGELMQSLTINIETTSARKNEEAIIKFENLIDNVLINTPNLESLTLTNICFQSYEMFLNQPNQPQLLTTPSLPKLKTLIINSSFPRISKPKEYENAGVALESTTRFHQVIQTLFSIGPALSNVTLNFEVYKRPRQVGFRNTELILHIKAAEAFYNNLTTMRIQLEELKIVADIAIERQIENIVKAHSLTLKTLHLTLPHLGIEPQPPHPEFIRVTEDQYHNPNYLPVMPELKTLTLIARWPPYVIEQISPNNTQFPILQTLTISYQLFQKCFPRNGRYPSVKQLNLIFNGFQIRQPGNVIVFQLFPNLTKLSIEITNTWSANITNNIHAIFKHAQEYKDNKVVDFTIKAGCSGILNQTLTGHDATSLILSIFNQLKCDAGSHIGDIYLKAVEKLMQSKPCLFSFKKLEALEIIAHADDKVGDETALLVLRRLGRLKKLSITNHKISPGIIEDLKKLHAYCSIKNPV